MSTYKRVSPLRGQNSCSIFPNASYDSETWPDGAFPPGFAAFDLNESFKTCRCDQRSIGNACLTCLRYPQAGLLYFIDYCPFVGHLPFPATTRRRSFRFPLPNQLTGDASLRRPRQFAKVWHQGNFNATVPTSSDRSLVRRHRVKLRQSDRLKLRGGNAYLVLEEPNDICCARCRKLPVCAEFVCQRRTDGYVVSMPFYANDFLFRILQHLPDPLQNLYSLRSDVRLTR